MRGFVLRGFLATVVMSFGAGAVRAQVADDPGAGGGAVSEPATAMEEPPTEAAEPAGPSIDELLGPIASAEEPPPAEDETLPGPSVSELLGPAPGSVPEAPPEPPGLSRWWFWSSVGLAVLTGIGGGIAGGLVLGAEDEYDTALAACRLGSVRACDDGPRIVSDFEDYRLATNVLLFSAGGFAIAALVLAFFTDFALPPPMDDTPLAPLFGWNDGPGAGLTLSF